MWINNRIFMGAHTQCKINLCTVGNMCSEMFNDKESYPNSLETTDLGGVANLTYVSTVGRRRPGGKLQSP